MKITIGSTISKITTMADRSLRLQVDTQELSSEEMAQIFPLYGKYGYFGFAEHIDNVDIKDLPPVVVDKDEKSPSQRLRGVLYVLWEQTGKKGTFEVFYRIKMEEIINHFKDKLV